ncbi:MAG: tetratricopeptide repeat protein [Chloroflexota bacterium]
MFAVLLIFAIGFFRGPLVFSYAWSNGSALTINQTFADYPLISSSQGAFLAEDLLQKATRFFPQNYYASRMMGYLLSSVGQEEAAVTTWQSIELPLDELIAWGQRAETNGSWQEAIIWYQRAALLSPKSSVPWYHMAQLYEQQTAWELALDAYHEAIARDEWADLPVLAGDAYARVALIYFSRLQPPDFERTLVTTDAAIQQDAFQAAWSAGHVHYLRGRVLWQNGRLDEAYEAFETAVSAYADDPNAHYWLGIAHYNVGRNTAEAIIELNASLALQPNNKWPYISLGQIYNETGDVQQAQEAYRQALAIDPTDVTIQERLSQLNIEP